MPQTAIEPVVVLVPDDEMIHDGLFRSDQKKTKVKKKTSNPQFEETFFFEVNSAAAHFVVNAL